MTPSLQRIGRSQSPIIVVDDVAGAALAGVIEAAAALAPFPAAQHNLYPGLRRIITQADGPANDYVENTLKAIAPFIGGGFDADSFDLIEASFSMVTAEPETLQPEQRAPHFDSTDPHYLAVLHYLSNIPGTGTAFYRQLSTGIETVTQDHLSRFVAAARHESAAMTGYIAGSTTAYEQIALVEAIPDRLVIYRGCLLHSGVIPADMSLSPDPREGRLTGNFFVRLT